MSKYRITFEGRVYEMDVEFVDGNESRPAPPVSETKENRQTSDSQRRRPATVASTGVSNKAGAVAAPMPGTVVSIKKEEGEAVKAGEVVLVLEAMKMENDIVANIDGTIVKMNCKTGGTVAGGEILFEVE